MASQRITCPTCEKEVAGHKDNRGVGPVWHTHQHKDARGRWCFGGYVARKVA